MMKLLVLIIFISAQFAYADYHKFERSINEVIPTEAEFHEIEAKFISCDKVLSFIQDLNSQLTADKQIHANCKNIQSITRKWSPVDIIRSKTILSSPTKLCLNPIGVEDAPDKYFNLYIDQIITDNTYNRVGEFILEDFGILTVYENDNPSYPIIGLRFPICP